MTEFEKQRLAYFIKQAEKSQWVMLGPGDADWLEELKHSYNRGHDEGFKDGIEYVVSGEMAHDEVKEEALKGTY